MASSIFSRNENFHSNRPYGVGNGSATMQNTQPAPTNTPDNPYSVNPQQNYQDAPPPPVSLPPVGSTGIMTFENTMNKVIVSFALVLVGALVGWALPGLTFPAMLIGLGLGLVNIFKKEPNKGLILAYAAVEGIFVGGLSRILEAGAPGIVSQAVIATACVIGVTLFLYKTGYIRTSPKMTKFFIIAGSAYLVFSLVNFFLMLSGATNSAWGLRTDITVFGIPLGLILGVFAVLMGAYSLIMDFDFVENGVANRIPEKYGWTAAFGIVVTVVWIYVEIIRLLSIIRN